MVYYLNSFFLLIDFVFWRSCNIHIKHTMYLQNNACSSWRKWRRNYICISIKWNFKLQFSYLKISWLKLTNIFVKWLSRQMPFCKRGEFAYYRFIRTKVKFESRGLILQIWKCQWNCKVGLSPFSLNFNAMSCKHLFC